MSAAEDGAGSPCECLPLGEVVSISGVVIGESRFSASKKTYLVEFERKGRVISDWFHREDLDVPGQQDGGGI